MLRRSSGWPSAMSDLDPELDIDTDPELDIALASWGWRTYEEAFGDRAEQARAAAIRLGEHENRAHTRGDLLSPRLLDLLEHELELEREARPMTAAIEALAPELLARVSVRFDVGADDETATRIAILLEALGYEAERVSLTDSLAWRIDELVRRCHLDQLERRVLELWIADRNNAQIAAELGLSRATVKWHTHNLLGKTEAGTRQGLLAMLLVAREPRVLIDG
jgi:DNA-binding CsgD family transcriptional regulator